MITTGISGGRRRIGTVVKSLLVLRCIWGRRAGIVFSMRICSRVGVTPRYHAEGDGDESLLEECSSGNIGFGLCILPSEPRLRRGPKMPYPKPDWPMAFDVTSPKSGLCVAGRLLRLRSTIDCEAKAFGSGRTLLEVAVDFADLGRMSLLWFEFQLRCFVSGAFLGGCTSPFLADPLPTPFD